MRFFKKAAILPILTKNMSYNYWEIYFCEVKRHGRLDPRK